MTTSASQEKMKGKNKLVPRLLGITKECVMRVDEKTKEVIQEWNLTNIKRWAASPKSFTLVSLGAQRGKGLEFSEKVQLQRSLYLPWGRCTECNSRKKRKLWNYCRSTEVRVEEKLLES